MKTIRVLFYLSLCLTLITLRGHAATYYVNAANLSPTPPFDSWVSAATNIQDAIDLTTNGDTVMVTDGVYAYGGLVMAGDLLDRVALTNAITVESVNGPWVTTILGAGAVNGTNAVRCAWLTNGATLAGFTLTGGATRKTGNSTSLESGGGVWCASSNAFLANCVIVSNTAYVFGSGIYQGRVTACLVSSNANYNNSGGAAYQAVMNNCTIVNNAGYGVSSPLAATNCIIYFNNPFNCVGSGNVCSHCCSIPALSGESNFTAAPLLLADGVHLATNSPCIGVGTGTPAGTDIFGNRWSNPPAVGCAEWSPVPAFASAPTFQFPFTGGVAISVAVAGQAPFICWWTKNGSPVEADADHTNVNTTTLLINSFALTDAGSYQVVVSNAFGMATSVVAQVSAHCVAPIGGAVPPYSDWASAATNIQDAINAAQAGDIVLVTNGQYTGSGLVMAGGLTNRVALNLPVMVQSVNGPWVTTIQGGNKTNGLPLARCAWLTNGAALVGFTLEGGAATGTGGTSVTSQSGGGVWCASSNALVANCLIYSNVASYYGGGAYAGTLVNCAIYQNSGLYGGGTSYGCLNQCTITANYGFYGGTYAGAFTNCILYYNSKANFSQPVSLSYCCTYPLPPSGLGNFTNPPDLDADLIHLMNNSPCIGAGTNLGATFDIAGQLWGNPPSVGCCEFEGTPLVGMPAVSLTNNPVGFVITVSATGAGSVSYWWLENGVPLAGGSQLTNSQTVRLLGSATSLANSGAYQLVVSNAFGVVTSAVVKVVIRAVDAANPNPEPPYSSWATAATNIQDAINVSAAGDIVLVTNGVYACGGLVVSGGPTNRVAITNAITVVSANGAAVTSIQGAWDSTTTNGPGAVRCAFVADGAVLNGFTLCNGATLATGDSGPGGPSESGGAIYCLTTNGQAFDCILSNNAAVWGAGLANGTLYNSLVVLNQAAQQGGGACYGTLNNCTVADNTAGFSAGGTWNSTVRNSIVLANYYGEFENPDSPYNNYYASIFPSYSYTCTSPLPSGGTGNIDTDPQFLNLYHIATTSPCVGAGSATYATGYDLDGQEWNTPPSMGCSEVVPVNLTGPLSVSVQSFWTNVLVNQYVPYDAAITGRAAWGQWSFGDGVTVSNTGAGAAHAWTNIGTYNVTFTVYNNDNPQGVAGSLPVVVAQPVVPQLQNAVLTTNGIQFEFAGQLFVNYTVQYATNLAPPVTWQTLQTIGYYESTLKITDPAITNGARFYRVLAQ